MWSCAIILGGPEFGPLMFFSRIICCVCFRFSYVKQSERNHIIKLSSEVDFGSYELLYLSIQIGITYTAVCIDAFPCFLIFIEEGTWETVARMLHYANIIIEYELECKGGEHLNSQRSCMVLGFWYEMESPSCEAPFMVSEGYVVPKTMAIQISFITKKKNT